jgi:hypothetical protein
MKIYYSLSGLSIKTIDDLNVYVLPFISSYCLLGNMICIIIFSNKIFNGIIYQLMMIESIAAILYSILNFFIFIFRCGIHCPYGYDYSSKIYELYVYIYIGKSIELFIILIDLSLSVLRYRSFSIKKKITKADNNLKRIIMIGVFILISLITCIIIVILTRTVDQIGYLSFNQTLNNKTTDRPLFTVIRSKLSNDQTFNIIVQIVTMVQGPGLLIIIMVINIMITVKLKRFLTKKSTTLSG